MIKIIKPLLLVVVYWLLYLLLQCSCRRPPSGNFTFNSNASIGNYTRMRRWLLTTVGAARHHSYKPPITITTIAITTTTVQPINSSFPLAVENNYCRRHGKRYVSPSHPCALWSSVINKWGKQSCLLSHNVSLVFGCKRDWALPQRCCTIYVVVGYYCCWLLQVTASIW